MALFDGLSLALVIFAGVRAHRFFAAYVPKEAVAPRWLTSVGLLLVATFLVVDMLVWLTPAATLGPLESVHPSLTWPAVLIGMGLFFLGSRRARQSRATQGLSDRTRLRILDAIIASSLTSFTLREPDGTFVYLNETYANTMRSMGIDPDTLVGKKLDDVLPQAGSDQTSENIIESVVRSGTPRENYRFKPARIKDDRFFLANFIPIKNDAQQVQYVVTTNIEVTETWRMQRSIEEQKRQRQVLLDALPVNVSVVDESGRYEFANEALAKRFGTTSAAMVGSDFGVFLPEPHSGQMREHMAQVLQGETQQFELTMADPKGQIRETELTYIPRINDSGEVTGFVTLGVDVSEKRALERQLQQAQKMEAVGQLTGGIAHDFNNLLAVIMGNAELLARRLDASNKKLDAILTAANQGKELTHRLLAISRRQPLEMSSVDLDVLTTSVTELLRRAITESINIELDIVQGLWWVKANPSQLENALLNLAINARDAMPEGGKLTIRCENTTRGPQDDDNPTASADTEFVLLTVQDTGTGMTQAIRERAFEPFFSTKEFGQGSGMGLAMVYGFARQSGGFIQLNSVQGAGTTVKLYLPRSTEPPEPTTAQDTETPQGNGQTILLVEDEAAVRDLAVAMLESLDYCVLPCADAASARAILTSDQTLDLVLSDVVLPGGESGPKLAKEVSAVRPELSFVFMSGYAPESVAESGSFELALTKPFRRQELARVVAEALP